MDGWIWVIPVRYRLNFKIATIALPGSLVGEFGVGLEGGAGGGDLFRAVRRIVGQGGDVVESGGVKNAQGELVTVGSERCGVVALKGC